MLGIKKFFFYVFGLALIALIGLTLYCLLAEGPDRGVALVMGAMCLVPLVGMLSIRSSTKCPHCKKVWVGKQIGDEDLGVTTNTYTKKVGDRYRTFEKHKHLLSFKCISCGNEWQKTVEKEKRLD